MMRSILESGAWRTVSATTRTPVNDAVILAKRTVPTGDAHDQHAEEREGATIPAAKPPAIPELGVRLVPELLDPIGGRGLRMGRAALGGTAAPRPGVPRRGAGE